MVARARATDASSHRTPPNGIVELVYANGHVEDHDAPKGSHFMIGARHGKAGPVTWFVLDRRERGRKIYVECGVEEP